MADGPETPLLSDPTAGELGEGQQTTNTEIPSDPVSCQSNPSLRTTMNMTWISTVFSVLALCFSVTIFIMNQHADPHYYMDWSLETCSNAMIALSAFTMIVSTINLVSLYRYQAAMWLLANLVLDGFITVYAVAISSSGLTRLFDGYSNLCTSYGYGDRIPPDEEAACNAFARRVVVVFGIAMAFGVVLAIDHLVFFVLRCAAAYRWVKRHVANGTFRFPAGQLSVEFTVKFLRQENTAECRAAVNNAQASEIRNPEGPSGETLV